jgi:hypothetical protein
MFCPSGCVKITDSSYRLSFLDALAWTENHAAFPNTQQVSAVIEQWILQSRHSCALQGTEKDVGHWMKGLLLVEAYAEVCVSVLYMGVVGGNGISYT